MVTKTVSINGFSLKSTWAYTQNDGSGNWSRPSSASTASKKIEVDLSDIPAGSRVKSATLGARASRNESKAKCNNVAVKVPAASPFTAVDVTGWFTSLTSKITIEFTYCDETPFSSGSSQYSGSTSWFRGNVSDSDPMLLTIVYELPNSTGTFNTSSVEAGASSSITLNISAINPEYTHSVVWSFFNQTYTHTLGAGVTTSTWAIPMSFCNEITNAASGTGQAILTTYNNGSPVGDPQTYTFTVTVPASVVPTASTLSASPLDTPSEWGAIYVQNFSRVRLILPNAAGAYGSSISSVVFSGGGWSADGTLSGNNYVADTGTITTKGTTRLQAVVTDSRGRTCTKTVDISVTAYTTPKITSTIVRRCTIDEYDNVALSELGTNALVTVNYSFASIGGKNHVLITSDYQVNNTGDFIPGPSLSNVTRTISMLTLGNGELSADSAHTIRVRVTDDVGNFVQTSVSIPTATYVLHFKDGGKSVAVGQAAIEEDSFTVNSAWHAYIGGADVSAFHPHLEYKGSVTGDLNSYVEMGTYSVESIVGVSNLPCQQTGQLIVMSVCGNEKGQKTIGQVYITSTADNIYMRVHNGSNYSVLWNKVFVVNSASSANGALPVESGGTGQTTVPGIISNWDLPTKIYAGNEITFPFGTMFGGIITGSSSIAKFTIPLGREIKAGSVTISGSCYIFGANDKIIGGDNGVDINTLGHVTASFTSGDTYVIITIHNASGDEYPKANQNTFFGAGNNKMYSLVCAQTNETYGTTNLKLTFAS